LAFGLTGMFGHHSFRPTSRDVFCRDLPSESLDFAEIRDFFPVPGSFPYLV
jgi:hypothetical protein